ncbi:MAG TPA: DUF805 domain-containing protein [Candidatus Baltobacteraceae bacterium]
MGWAARLFSFSGTIGRGSYVGIALVCVLIKHGMDLSLAALVFHRDWSPLSYLMPLGVPLPVTGIPADARVFVVTMLATSLPFAWIGTAITVKRFRAIGWPEWMVVLFFVPVANVASFAVAAAWPEHSQLERSSSNRWLGRIVPVDRLGAAVFALVATTILGVAAVALGTRVMGSYGWGLFAAIPFSQGALAAILAGVHRHRSLPESLLVALLSVALTCVALLAVALEGAICIAMATPIALVFALIGGLFGHVCQDRTNRPRANPATLLVCALVAPLIMGAEAIVPRETPTYMVRSSIDVNAPPMVVWRNVVRFPDLPPPTELPFRIGIAYPIRARIVGSGVGAVRYCEFSTGNFVEPITDWEPGRRLAFRVARSAEPMRELTPYGTLDTPHLHGYMVSKHGEFVLEPLPGGRTRLIGITWYQHHLWPAAYWAVYSDAIVHEIHMRVLQQIKRLSERRPVAAPRGNRAGRLRGTSGRQVRRLEPK